MRGPAAPGGLGQTTVTADERPPLGYASITSRQDAGDRLALPPRRRTAAPLRFGLPLLASDWASALLGTALLDSGQRHAVLIAQLLVCVAILNAYAGLYRPSGPRTALDEFPALAARTLVAWCASAALLAALHPSHALSLTALLAGSATQLLLACCGRAGVHGYRRRTTRKRLTSALVVGMGPTGRRFAALFARHPEYGLRPVGIVAPAEGDGPGDPDGGPRHDGVGEDHPADAYTPAPDSPC